MRRVLTLAVVSFAAATAMLAAPSSAHAEGRYRLRYQRSQAARSCPDEGALRAGIGARLGGDPFVDDAGQAIVCEVGADAGGGLRAVIRVVGADGLVRGERVLSSGQGDCAELASAVELAIAVFIDPEKALAAAPPVAVEERPPVAVVAAPAPGTPAAAPAAPVAAATVVSLPPIDVHGRAAAARAPVWSLGAAVSGSSGLLPEPAVGLSIGAAKRRGLWSVGLSLGWAGLASLGEGAVRVTAGEAAASLCRAPPGLARRVWVCAASGAGLIAAGRESFDALAPLLWLGGRVELELLADGDWKVIGFGQLAGVAAGARLRAGDEGVLWQSPGAAGLLGVRVAWQVR